VSGRSRVLLAEDDPVLTVAGLAVESSKVFVLATAGAAQCRAIGAVERRTAIE